MNEVKKITGTKAVAQRIVNAQNGFIAILMAKGFNEADATKAMKTMLKLKVAKLDAVSGVINVKHGAFLEADVIKNAVDYKA